MMGEVTLRATQGHDPTQILQALSDQRNVRVMCKSEDEEWSCVTASGAVLGMWSGMMRTILCQRLDATYRTDEEEFVVILPDFRCDTIQLMMEFLTGRLSKFISSQMFNDIQPLLNLLDIKGIDGEAIDLKQEPNDVPAQDDFSYQPSLWNDEKPFIHQNDDEMGEFLDVDLEEDQKPICKRRPLRFKCLKCKKKFRDKRGALRHVVTHFKVPLYQCTECDQTFVHEAAAYKHTRVDHQGKYYVSMTKTKQTDELMRLYIVKIKPVFRDELEDGEEVEMEEGMKEFHELLDLSPPKYEPVFKAHPASVDTTDYRYTCGMCGKKFKFMKYIKQHLAIHLNMPQYKCSDCSERFNVPSGAHRHNKSAHNGQATIVFEKNQELLDLMHKNILKDDEPLDEEMPVEEEDIKVESKISHAFECKICLRKFRDKDHARQHTSVHFKIPQIQCLICNKTYMARSAGQYHLKKTHDGKGKMAHINADKLQEVLNKYFNRLDIEQVKSEEDGDEIGSFECQRCRKKFHRKFLFEAHQEYAYEPCESISECICEICGFEAPSIAKLQRHQNTHMETSKYKCLQCNKAFTMPQALKFHMLIHTGEKLFVCEICGREFLWKRALDAHVLGVHEKMNRYQCGICNAKYRNRLNVRRHLVSHFSIPQYACTECKTEFMVASTCSKHVKKTHDGKGGVTVTNTREWKELADKHIVMIHSRKKAGRKKQEFRPDIVPNVLPPPPPPPPPISANPIIRPY